MRKVEVLLDGWKYKASVPHHFLDRIFSEPIYTLSVVRLNEIESLGPKGKFHQESDVLHRIEFNPELAWIKTYPEDEV